MNNCAGNGKVQGLIALGEYQSQRNVMSITALNLPLVKVYAASTICGRTAMEALKKLVLMIGENAKNTLLIQLGLICADTIVKTFQILGKMIFGRLSKMFLKNRQKHNHLELIQQNLGAKTTFIGKKEDQVLRTENNICGNGVVKLDLQMLITTSIKILKKITMSLLSGIATSFPSKAMSVLSVSNPKRLLSETRLFLCRWIIAIKQEKQEVCFAQNAIVGLGCFVTIQNFLKAQFNISYLTLNRRK